MVVAALVDSGPHGRWAEDCIAREYLVAPELLPAEVATILRRAALSGDISGDTASLAHGDLLSLRIDLIPYEPVAHRTWELRQHLTVYDSWYVAIAELLGVPLATLDSRLTRAPGPQCTFAVPAK
ncbi:MAG TPA: type II toxin-antitoxin system VapC family toxin [Gemmatimonadaceae bacterium]|nr:type II toxin-antitoxin system VapC family toxin [Gemmatimonadaceae bacterium]